MTEAEWLSSIKAYDMVLCLKRLKRQTSGRKWRMFDCACARRVWHRMTNEASRQAIEVTEQIAERKCGRGEREAIFHQTHEMLPRTVLGFALNTSFSPTHFYAAAQLETAEEREAEVLHQCQLLRDIFGNPFQPVSIEARWKSSTVLDLSRTIYEQRTFDLLPILADALMDAGCDSDAILQHCRSDGVHVKGCWVVDLLLGKE